MKNRFFSLLSLLMCLGFMVGCSFRDSTGFDGQRSKAPKINAVNLVRYDDCAQLNVELKELLFQQVEAEIDHRKTICYYRDFRADPIPTAEDGAESLERASYTDTNIQEAGVDEADLIKTDGKYIFAIIGDVVMITSVWPVSEFKRISEITPARGKAKALFLDGSKLVVISTLNGAHSGSSAFYQNSDPVPEFTALEYYDVTTPSSPSLIKKEEFDGEFVSARMIASNLYLVLNLSIEMPQLQYSFTHPVPDCDENGTPKHLDGYVESLENLKNDLIPQINSLNLDAIVEKIEKAGGGKCDLISRSHVAFGRDLITLISRDINSADISGSSEAILGNGGTVYASSDNLFIGSKFRDFHALFSSDASDNTVVHRMKIGGQDLIYGGSTALEGYLLDNSFAGSRLSSRYSMSQFAMSEYDGHFRVAMTRGWWSGNSDVNDTYVTVFKINDDSFDEVGRAEGIAEGERLYAVRFINDRAYLVTFLQVDPFFVMDLSDPTSPKVQGELKIPGFSTYLHPLDGNRIIGLGFGATDEGDFGWRQGIKLALFDVSDPSNPIEVGSRVFGSRGSYSSAVEEHHAFTFDAKNRILALPLEMYEGGDVSTSGDYKTSGLSLINVDDAGKFDTIGRVETFSGESSYYDDEDSDQNKVLRSVILDDGNGSRFVLSLTSDAMLLNKIDANMTQIGKIQ